MRRLDTIILDLDGTLSDHEWRLHHVKGKNKNEKDWDAFYTGVQYDEPIKDMCALVHAVKAMYDKMALSTGSPKLRVIVVTGRSEVCRSGTLEWLESVFDKEYNQDVRMRQEGDHRPDNLVKRDLISDIDPNRVWFVLEDRHQVAEMYRERGFRVLHVENGDF